MNAAGRKRLAEATAKIEEAKEILQDLAEDERSKFDSMNEGLQQTESGQRLGANADALEDAVGALEGIDLEEVS